jgi:hypothetical protein
MADNISEKTKDLIEQEINAEGQSAEESEYSLNDDRRVRTLEHQCAVLAEMRHLREHCFIAHDDELPAAPVAGCLRRQPCPDHLLEQFVRDGRAGILADASSLIQHLQKICHGCFLFPHCMYLYLRTDHRHSIMKTPE